jgi:hypothetical protein
MKKLEKILCFFPWMEYTLLVSEIRSLSRNGGNDSGPPRDRSGYKSEECHRKRKRLSL